MSKFPPSIPLPESVSESRYQRRRQMMVTARRGVILRGVIIVAEIFGFVFLNSSALLLDAISSLHRHCLQSVFDFLHSVCG